MGYPSLQRPDSRRRDLALTALLLFGAWMLARLGPPAQMQVTRTLRSTVLAPFITAHSAIAERRVLAHRAGELQVERDSLALRVLELSGVAEENEGLRRLLGLAERAVPEFVVTELTPGRPPIGESHTFLLRAGSADGIEPPVGAFTSGGLVGVVRSAGAGTSTGEFWTHPEFAVSVRTEDGAATGIVRAVERGDGTAMLLEGAPYQADIHPGTRLVTAGVGGIHPPGIPIGTVREMAAPAESGWERSYLVEPAVRPEQARVVLVWRRPAGHDLGPGAGAEADSSSARGGERTAPAARVSTPDAAAPPADAVGADSPAPRRGAPVRRPPRLEVPATARAGGGRDTTATGLRDTAAGRPAAPDTAAARDSEGPAAAPPAGDTAAAPGGADGPPDTVRGGTGAAGDTAVLDDPVAPSEPGEAE